MGYRLMWDEVHQTFHVTLEASYQSSQRLPNGPLAVVPSNIAR